MRATWWVVMALASCGDNGVKVDVDAPKPIDAPAGPDACVAGNPAAHVIYLNGAGGTFSPGADNAGTNTTSILNAAKTLPATTVDPTEWASFVTCVKSKFAPFAVTITEVDPGTAPHMELVVIDNAASIGQSSGIFGLAPYACDGTDGKVADNAIAFLMWNAGVTERCATGAQMIGNLMGLDHSFSCPDLMTYLSNCGPSDTKTFINMDVPCGEFQGRNCNCGKATQNSFRTIAKTAGPSCP